MAFLDFFRPKWKHSDGSVRKQALNSGKLSQSTLIKIIGRKKESASFKRSAIAKVKDDRKLAKLVFGKGRVMKDDIVKKIKTIALLEELEKEACQQNLEMFASLIKSRIEDVETGSYGNKSNQDLKEILDKEITWQRTKAALAHISDPPLLVQWLTKKVEQDSNYRGYSMNDAVEAIERINFETVLKEVQSLSLLNVLAQNFYDDKNRQMIGNHIIKLNKAKEYLRQYDPSSKEILKLLLKTLNNQKDIIEIAQSLKLPSHQLIAYTMANDEVQANGKYLCEMISIIQNSKERVDDDVEAFLKKLGQKVIYRMEEKKRPIECDICNGTGRMPYCDHGEKCDSCNGSGHDGYDTYEVIESIVVN